MDKPKMHSPDMTQDNIAKIRDIFPGCVTEAADEKGGLRLAVDFDQLRQELSGKIVEGPQERYRLDWPGKREALLTANAPIAKTLRPARDESVDFDTTQNLFIEGDNLDALKLLQESYLGKVKMIYIDPPYNTGNDFIYEDDFAEDSAEFLARSNQKDEDGNRLVANSESNGRFHSDWLSMMYSRLKLARNLLVDNGFLFVSIGDDEQSSLTRISDEVFGEENRIATFIWNTEGHTDNQYDVKVNHEYVVLYAKSTSSCLESVVDPNTREESNLWRGFAENSITKNGPANPPSPILLPIGFPVACDSIDIEPTLVSSNFFSAIERAGCITRQITKEFEVSYPIRRQEMTARDGALISTCEVFSGWANRDKLLRFIEGGCKPIDDDGTSLHFYLSKKGVIYYRREREEAKNVVSVLKHMGTTEKMRSELEGEGVYFQYPKPHELISYLVQMGTEKNAVMLDFFAGSASSADSVMRVNAQDGGNRKFIMVQLPEETDEKSEAHKAGYENIAEISKERIRRAGTKILEGECHEGWNKDVGFRVLKVDTSNMADVWYTPEETNQDDLLSAVENIKPDRSGEDLLFQLLIDWGVGLSLPITRETLDGKTVYRVDDNALVACFDDGVDEALVKQLAALKPLRAVFKDNGFADNDVKTNVTQIFKQLSPNTEVKSI